MHIKINKDFQTEYKEELFRGLSAKEAVSLAAGAGVAGLLTFLLYDRAGVPVEAGIYAGVFCAIPVLMAGFLTIQGLSPARYFKEAVYAYRTRLLVYGAGELAPGRPKKMFTMKKRKGRHTKRGWIKKRVPDSGTHQRRETE